MRKILLMAVLDRPIAAFALAVAAVLLSVLLFGSDRTWEALIGIYVDATSPVESETPESDAAGTSE